MDPSGLQAQEFTGDLAASYVDVDTCKAQNLKSIRPPFVYL